MIFSFLKYCQTIFKFKVIETQDADYCHHQVAFVDDCFVFITTVFYGLPPNDHLRKCSKRLHLSCPNLLRTCCYERSWIPWTSLILCFAWLFWKVLVFAGVWICSTALSVFPPHLSIVSIIYFSFSIMGIFEGRSKSLNDNEWKVVYCL